MTAETAPTPTDQVEEEQTDEIEEILAEDHDSTLNIEGIPVKIKRMRTRELLKALRIMTEGFGARAAMMSISGEDSEDAVAAKLLAAFVNSIPYAENSVIEFVKTMVSPVDEDDPEQHAALARALDNPEVEDLVEVIKTIIDQEKGNFTKLGKDAMAWWKTMNPDQSTTP